MPFQAVFRLFRLELYTACKLDNARREGRSNTTEGRTIDALALTLEEVNAIRHVKCFGANLEPDVLRDPEGLEKPHVKIGVERAIDGEALKAARLSRCVVEEHLTSERS